MKYLVILTDGMSDYKIEELQDMTPLQYAHTPNMDALAKTSLIGLAKTVPADFPPGSDVANLSVLGFNPQKYYTGRSPLEAVSMGVTMADDDLSLRCNLVTLSDANDYAEKTMLDYSAGEITSEEAALLIAAINEKLGNDTLQFYPGIGYRHLLLWRSGVGKEFNLTPPHDISGRKLDGHLPAGADSDAIQELMLKSQDILQNHPINLKRIAQGLKPANSIWLWGQGTRPRLSSFADKYHLKGAVVAAVDLVKGLGICAGLDLITVEGATGGVHTNFAGKAQAAIEALKGNYDFVYVHIESPDESGHQGVTDTKVWSIEQVDDKVFGLLRESLADFEDIRILVTPDHPTPVKLKTHTSDPVPFMIFDKNNPITDSPGKYDEESAEKGIFVAEGHKLMDLLINGQI
jgi:2,3-bisphosphoglycerate-independent phosphoglycerate mutase